MPEIILTEEQARIVAQAIDRVTVRDASGRVLGHVEPQLTPEKIAELKSRARKPGPRYTGDQVHARLVALQQEWERTGGFDETAMREFLKRLDAIDPPRMHPGEMGNDVSR